jgi:DNA modification methylase
VSDLRWTNEKRKLSELKPWPRNPRQIKKDQAERLVDSFDTFGQVETIAIGPEGDIYNGHQRLNVLVQQHGADYEVDVRVASRPLSEKEREKLTVFLHKGAAGEWDFDVLANEFEIDDLLDWGFDERELDLDMWRTEEPAEDPGAQIDKAEELREKWGVESGQLWQLGAHRLICGDCTDKAVVERVMGGEKAQLVFTDPPYGVDYDGGTKVREKLDGDTSTDLYMPACKTSADYSDKKAALYLWHAGIKGIAAAAAAAAAGYEIRCELVWNKNQAQYGALSAQYKQKHEPMYYCYKKGQAPRWFGPTNEVTVWDCNRASVNQYHPTQKPVELAERAMNNSSEKGDIVVDWFLGSGSTLIACERLHRKCRAVEISPAYCAVAIQRWVDMTGGEPVILESA